MNEYILRGSTYARRQWEIGTSQYQPSLMDGEKANGRIDVEERMQEIIDGIPDLEAQKSHPKKRRMIDIRDFKPLICGV